MGSTSGSCGRVGHHRVRAGAEVWRTIGGAVTRLILHLSRHMAQHRKTARRPGRTARGRPLTARSVVASTLLGRRPAPPADPAARALRRAVRHQRGDDPGGAVADGGGGRAAWPTATPTSWPAGCSSARPASRPAGAPASGAWTGDWTMAVVTEARRPVAARAELRPAMGVLRLAELARGRVAASRQPRRRAGPPRRRGRGRAQCRRFRRGRPDPADGSPGELAAGCGTSTAGTPGRRAARRAGRGGGCARGRRHRRAGARLRAVGRRCCATCWPTRCCPPSCCRTGWPGDDLRADYDRYDRAFKALWREWFRREAER